MRRTERAAATDLEAQGWTILSQGWPDFLAIKDGKVRLIEVKRGENDAIQLHQYAMFKALKEAFGVEVEIVYPPKSFWDDEERRKSGPTY